MRIEYFRYLFKREYDIFWFNEHLALHKKPYNITDYKTGLSVDFKTVDEMLNYQINGKTVKQLIEKTDKPYIPPLDGGRGASGGNSKSFKFNHARGDGAGGSSILPAVANTRIKSKSLNSALAEFKRNHLLANREFSYAVDENGFVTGYNRGKAHSVAIPYQGKLGRGKKSMIIHNHPSGGAFSDTDLLNTATDRRTKGIIASGKNYDYKFSKGSHFKVASFTKAVKNATMTGKDYDDAVDKWLKKNQKKYGYSYSRSKN